MSKPIRLQAVARRAITLIEVMIVMFLIALIAGVVAYNYRGSLDSGKAFTTEQNMAKLRNLLDLETAKTNVDLSTIPNNWEVLLRKSPLVKSVDSLSKDGWGESFRFEYDNQKRDYKIRSERYEAYLQDHPEHAAAKQ